MLTFFSFFFFLQILRRSISDHHGWLNFEVSKMGGKHSGWAIKTIYKKTDRDILKRIPLDPWFK